jgi:Spy/CpxP family protein refolding chaperone
MKTKILMLAAMLVMVLGVSAQQVRDVRMFRGMNLMRPDSDKLSDIRGFARMNMERQRRMNQEGLVRALDLNDDQIKAIKDIQLSMHKEIKPLQNQLGEAMAHQKTLLSSDNPNLNAINDNIEKIGQIKIDMAKTRTKYLLQMRSRLTDEQRMKLDLMREHHRKFGPGMNKGKGGPGFGRPGMGFDMNQF